MTPALKSHAPTAKHLARGFTLLEVVTVAAITALILLALFSLVLVSQRTLRTAADQGEIAQNARIALQRLSRDIRQAEALVTVIPPTDTDPLNPAPSELEFQDGNDPNALTYIRFYLNGTNLQRETSYYSFPSTPAVHAAFNDTNSSGNHPAKTVLTDILTAEYVSSIKFYGATLITADIDFAKGDAAMSATTTLYARNLP